jgi:ABC-2 type transport system permease protein
VLNAYRSEWVKLRRPALFFGAYGAIAGITVLATVVTFATAGHVFGHGTGQGPRGAGVAITFRQLAEPNGLTIGLTGAGTVLGVIAFAVAAAQTAGEYSYGTLRNLLVRQPHRLTLLAGKYVALLAFLVGAVVVAAAAGSGTAAVMAHLRGVDMKTWTSLAGFRSYETALGDIVLAVVGYATLGLALGAVLRSSVAAISIGVAYLLPVEMLIANFARGADAWLPGQLLTAVDQDGTAAVGFEAALLKVALLLAVLVAGSAVVFVRRDVTA